MEADELKAFLTDSAGQPPTDFQLDLDGRNRWLNWWNIQIREHFGSVDVRVSPVEFGDPTYIHSLLSIGTLVTTFSSDLFEATLYFVRKDGNLTTLFAHSQVHAGPVDYIDQWVFEQASS